MLCARIQLLLKQHLISNLESEGPIDDEPLSMYASHCYNFALKTPVRIYL